ncbi:lysine-specific demethylase 3A-like [Oppia nitens]|uniref:lysine-specific demethylase 3A-like n=1 Tax=Oppia nitens TaxID=1686743 RepID=UPI0023DCDA69|nr:lysine-specific demethylase 3A-like [Oppia nitens]
MNDTKVSARNKVLQMWSSGYIEHDVTTNQTIQQVMTTNTDLCDDQSLNAYILSETTDMIVTDKEVTNETQLSDQKTTDINITNDNPSNDNQITTEVTTNVIESNQQIKTISEKHETKERKIKRHKPNKVVIVKKLGQQKSFLDFIDQKFNPFKEGVALIQDRPCNQFVHDFPDQQITCCMDCIDKKRVTQTCRFYQYRTLIKENGQMKVYGFAEESNASIGDCRVWLPEENVKKIIIDKNHAKYLLGFVSQQFCRIYNDEKDLRRDFEAITWKKPVKGIRELCDICETTIFNTHYVCPNCGLAVCVDCYVYRSQQSMTNEKKSRLNHDEFGWLLCHKDKHKEKHDIKDLHLALFITKAVFDFIDNLSHEIRNEHKIKGICECRQLDDNLNMDIKHIYSDVNLKSQYSNVPQQWFFDEKLLVLTDPKCKQNIDLFQVFWLKGYPVMMQGVHTLLKQDLWSPESFNKNYGKQQSRLVNCLNGHIMPKTSISVFWDGFEDVTKRLLDQNTGQEMILKLKDWPPDAEFRDKLPIWYDNLMEALPMNEYTRYDGPRNLASRLPNFFVRPDLGPKMYCAYGSVMHTDKGSTNLHLDMSDAVNVMVYVGIAHKNGVLLESHINAQNDALVKGGCDQQMMDRMLTNDLKVGAIWHIWRAEDANKIREFIRKVAKERNMKSNEITTDPIHDQSWYLDETLRTRLEQEYGVRGMAIAQCLGDGILVPAGAPHQVQNIHSCIKVAGEFVSPENVGHCVSLTQEFRKLSKRHNNHEDKLQIKNIIYHTIKDCLSVLVSSSSISRTISLFKPTAQPILNIQLSPNKLKKIKIPKKVSKSEIISKSVSEPPVLLDANNDDINGQTSQPMDTNANLPPLLIPFNEIENNSSIADDLGDSNIDTI